MNKRKSLFIIVFFLTISITFLSIVASSTENKNDYMFTINQENNFLNKEDELKTSNGEISLSYSSIFRNTTIIRRGFDSINITVNVSAFATATKTYMRIYFTNNTNVLINMSYIPGTNKNFTYTYTPEGYAPLGIQRVNFEILNNSDYQLNTGDIYTNFTIRSNSMVGFNSSQYYRNQYLLADITIDNSENFQWEVSAVNSTDILHQKTLTIVYQNPFQVKFLIDDNFDIVNKDYYLKVNMSENGVQWIADYFGFYVNNTNPIFYENTIQFNPTSVFRTERCDIRVNVNDSESNPSNINVKIRLIDPNRNVAYTQTLYYSGNGQFIGNFTISAGSPKGIYEVEFEATDDNGGKSTVLKKITIKNNLPKIDGFEINDIDTDEPISVNYGDDLKFKFDVTDVEGVAYVTIKLIMEDATSDDVEEYEITREYEDDLEITIRTEDLAAGTWTVYVSVTDTDGATTDLADNFDSGPQQITVIPDLLTSVMPWITLIVGSILGIIAGLGIGFYMRKSKYPESKPEEAKPITKKKTIKVKESITPTKPKAIEKESVKKPEKKEPKEPTTKRKIKRKL